MIKKIVKFINRSGDVSIVQLLKDHSIHEEITANNGQDGILVSMYSKFWTLTDLNGKAELLLDIDPNDKVLYVYRGKYLIVESSKETFNVLGNKMSNIHEILVYDVYTGVKLYQLNEARMFGEWINECISGERRAVHVDTGITISSKLLNNYEIIDVIKCEKNDEVNGQLSNSPILSSSPLSGITKEGNLYILKQRNTTDTYQILFGPSMNNNSKLYTILKFQGKYLHANNRYIMYNNRIVEFGNSSKSIMTIETSLINNGIEFHLTDAYFISESVISLHYSSANFDLLMKRNIIHDH